MTIGFDRRSFLGALGAVLGAQFLGACSSSSAAVTPAGPDAGTSDDIDARLADLRAALAPSPDLLRARADEAVKTGDPGVIARFVREQIGVLTPLSSELPASAIRFGARGALRAGVGSFRDRAELLAELLTAAGFTSTVVQASRSGWGSEVYTRPTPQFLPDAAMLASIGSAVGVQVPSTFSDDADATQRANAAVTKILAALPSDSRAASTKAGDLPTDVSIVEFSKGGGAKSWAIALGNIDVTDAAPAGLTSASSPSVPSVQVAVSVALVPPQGSVQPRNTLMEVVAGEWPVDQVVGRCVSLTFAPPVPPEQAIGYDVTSFPVRTPVLRLHSLEALPDSAVDTYGGLAVTMTGAIYGPSADDPSQVVGPYGPVPAPLDTAGRAAARARASTIAASANPGAFPAIDLAVSVLDGQGKVVDGFGSDDLVVTEDGTVVNATIIANAPPAAVRILVLYDTSGSVQESWSTPQAKADFETTLAAALVAAAADAPFVVQIIGLGATPSADWQAPDASQIAATLASILSNSDVWASVGQVIPQSGASAAIMVSDCVSSLEDQTQIPLFQKAMAAAGIPVAVVPIGQPDTAAVELIVSSTGGVQLDPSDAAIGAKLTKFVHDRVATRLSTAYRLRYQAPETGPSTRSVQVAIQGNPQVGGSTTYDVPAEVDRVAPSGLAGIYLSVTVAGVTDVRRLGGVELTSSGRPFNEPGASDVAECAVVLNSVTSVCIDAPGSTNAQRLDDTVVALSTLGPLRRAPPDDPAAIATAAQGIKLMPWLGAALFEPVGAADGVTPPGLTVRVISTRLTSDGLELTSDIPPALVQMIGTSSDPTEAFGAALRATVGGSVRESDWMASSAAASLANQSLVVAPNSDGLPSWPETTKAAFRPLLWKYDQYIRLVPDTGAVTALWVVDPQTGSATAISDDGHGGGSKGCRLAAPSDLGGWISAALTLISLACTATGPSSEGPSTSPYACVQANVYGVGVLAYGSFTNPASLLTVGGIAGVLGTAFGYVPTIPSVAGKAVSIYLQLMLATLGQVTCE